MKKSEAVEKKSGAVPLNSVYLYLKNEGLKVDKDKFFKMSGEEKKEFMKELISDLLKSKFDEISEVISEKRKDGVDLFIEHLKLMQLKSKLKIALSNFLLRDVEVFIHRFDSLKKDVDSKIVKAKDED